jgi:hypothetical protein
MAALFEQIHCRIFATYIVHVFLLQFSPLLCDERTGCGGLPNSKTTFADHMTGFVLRFKLGTAGSSESKISGKLFFARKKNLPAGPSLKQVGGPSSRVTR